MIWLHSDPDRERLESDLQPLLARLTRKIARELRDPGDTATRAYVAARRYVEKALIIEGEFELQMSNDSAADLKAELHDFRPHPPEVSRLAGALTTALKEQKERRDERPHHGGASRRVAETVRGSRGLR